MDFSSGFLLNGIEVLQRSLGTGWCSRFVRLAVKQEKLLLGLRALRTWSKWHHNLRHCHFSAVGKANQLFGELLSLMGEIRFSAALRNINPLKTHTHTVPSDQTGGGQYMD